MKTCIRPLAGALQPCQGFTPGCASLYHMPLTSIVFSPVFAVKESMANFAVRCRGLWVFRLTRAYGCLSGAHAHMLYYSDLVVADMRSFGGQSC